MLITLRGQRVKVTMPHFIKISRLKASSKIVLKCLVSPTIIKMCQKKCWGNHHLAPSQLASYPRTVTLIKTSLLKITKIGYALAMEIIQAMLISPFAVWIFSFSIC